MARSVRIAASYEPLPTQEAFHRSQAKVKGYGGAMGGGKSKALCEEAFQAALDYPGIEIVMARQEHTAITISTRKTMFREVLPPALTRECRIVKSGGYDFIEFPNGSVIHFVGLSDVVKFHSAEIGLLVLDEAHQIAEDDVMTLNTRLRQKCSACLAARSKDCNHLPRQILCAFNPENPGHWLYRWFLADADRTEWGYYKPELRLDPDADPIGDAEFVVAKATDNPYLPDSYIERELRGMKEFHRRRYLEGEWLFVSGNCFFDEERLTEYAKAALPPLRRLDFKPVGIGDRAKVAESKMGRIRIYREPEEDSAYAIGCDSSSGHGQDSSSAYVVDLSDMALVAEFHAKVDPDLLAEQLHFLGRLYNSALVAVEAQGGWGTPVIISLRDGKSGRPPYPRLYRHVLDTQVDMPTTKGIGYPMNVKTRKQVLSYLGQAVREAALPWMTHHLVSECLTFCEFEEGTPTPRAQPGCHDDAVMAAAITLELFRQRGHHPEREMRIEKRRKDRSKLKKLLARDPFYGNRKMTRHL